MRIQEQNITNQLIAALGEGVYGVDSKGRCTFINPSALTMLGYESDEVLGKDQHALFHHHRPTGDHYAHCDCPIHLTLKDGMRRQVNETFIHKDGHFIPIRLIVTPIEDADEIVGAVIAFSDMSDLIEAQAAMRSERDLFAQGPVSVLVWDLHEHWPLSFASENVIHIFGYSAQQMTDEHFRYADCIHPEDLAGVAAEVEQFIHENRNKWEQHYRIFRPDGSIRYLHDHTTSERDSTGKIVQLHGYLIDETRQKKLEQALTEMATTDGLTGLANRRHLMNELEAECARFRRMGNAISVLMLDLDHFKRINDTWGHAAGDAVLYHFSEVIKTLIRKTDRIGRFGGEEFVIVLPETTAQGALVFAEKVRGSINESTVIFEDIAIHYTVSIGIASCTDRKAENADSILQKADQALYQAKTKGRNCVVSIDVCAPLNGSSS
jgi:diguanylate cyclase (GGDEF)-like protein/PAS domain S-box-containing protein